MAKTILVVGFGPGISSAVAEKFGSSGFSVALVARNAERLAAGVKALEEKGIKAAAFPADAGDSDSIRGAVKKAREALGPITVLQWTAYGGAEAADLLAVVRVGQRGGGWLARRRRGVGGRSMGRPRFRCRWEAVGLPGERLPHGETGRSFRQHHGELHG